MTFLPLTFAGDLGRGCNSKPCFLKILAASLRTSPSMPGRIWSRNSTTVTLAPSRRQTEPSSSPITPPPITTRWPGTSGKLERAGRIDDDLMIDLDAGQRRDAGAGGDDDVLRGDALAGDVDAVLPVNAARPFSQSTLFFLNRNSMPPVSSLTASPSRRASCRDRASTLRS